MIMCEKCSIMSLILPKKRPSTHLDYMDFFFFFSPQLKLYSYHVNGHVLNKVYSKYGEM